MDYKFNLRYTVILILLTISDSEGNFENVCGTGKCVAKCCPGKAYVYENECVHNDTFKADFSDVNVYDNNLIRTGNLKGAFRIVDGQLFDIVPQASSLSVYLLENGNLYVTLTTPNAFPKITIVKNDRFCVDYLQENGTFVPMYAVAWEENSQKNIHFTIAALIISCIFLLLVLIIYSLLKELRNLKGKILMAMVLSLLGAFITLVTWQIKTNDEDFEATEELCFSFTSCVYFFFLATFCWMNIMSFDIWWTLRSMTTRRKIHRRGKQFKFIVYCIYAWGVPAVMTTALIVIEQSDLTEKPWIIKPNIIEGGCFLSGKEKLMYLYIPMLILILSNWLFFLMTAYNFWRFGRDTEMLNSNTSTSNKHRNQKQRFLIYLKLSLIMGISWVLEVISSVNPNLSFWYITDAYNMLIGFAIFLIFVCKKSIFTKLSRRFQRNRAEYSMDTNPTSSS